MSAFLLAGILAVWLGIAGPINIEGLQRWQTLLASFVAVIAATIAYFAAMAKVRQDKQISEEQVLRRALAIFLKLEFAIQVLRQEARDLEKKVQDYRNKSFKTADLAILEPKEMLEAWDTLDLFPSDLMQALRMLRALLVGYKMDLAKFEPDVDWERNIVARMEINPTARAAISAKLIIEHATKALQTLFATIDRQRDRLERL
jgi:hypothetical protein